MLPFKCIWMNKLNDSKRRELLDLAEMAMDQQMESVFFLDSLSRKLKQFCALSKQQKLERTKLSEGLRIKRLIRRMSFAMSKNRGAGLWDALQGSR
ncbi:hypothetical protein Ciccas_014376 [Cichlidogyrus casuarinus]|uniref:Uncharacterized protein n=1 Tax=Cichlidogyrus casuarinus TaxID=1844966 RepID=A0ABD2PIF1_9PLAT